MTSRARASVAALGLALALALPHAPRPAAADEPPVAPGAEPPVVAPEPAPPPAEAPPAPVMVAPIDPAPAPSPPPAAPARPRPPAPRVAFGFEFGYGTPQDPTNIYGDGLGMAFVVAVRGFELRAFEYYDLEDKTGRYDAVRGAQGQLGISSLGYRVRVTQVGRVGLGVLLGGAWLRRSSLRYDEEDAFANDGFERHSQHGLGALLGGGGEIRVGPLLLGLDARIYPTYWSTITGMRASDPGPIETITESPTGIPITANVWVTFVVK